jgi:hypothetical protein
MGEMGCRRYLDFTVFRLFADADIDIATRGTIRIDCSDKFNSLVCSGRNDTSELIILQTFGAPNAAPTGLIGRLMSTRLVFPQPVEPIRAQVGVAHRVLDIPMSEVVLQRPGIDAVIGQLEAAGMAKHVGMDREWHLGGLPKALDEPVETDGTDGPAALGNEHVGVCGVIAA